MVELSNNLTLIYTCRIIYYRVCFTYVLIGNTNSLQKLW